MGRWDSFAPTPCLGRVRVMLARPWEPRRGQQWKCRREPTLPRQMASIETDTTSLSAAAAAVETVGSMSLSDGDQAQRAYRAPGWQVTAFTVTLAAGAPQIRELSQHRTVLGQEGWWPW